MDDTIEFLLQKSKHDERQAKELIDCIMTATKAGKEPFTMEAFEAEQVKQNKTLDRELSPQAWFVKYYCTYPKTLTVADFVADMYEVDAFV